MDAPVLPKRVYRFGLFQVDPHNGELLRQGVPIKLQEQPLRVLCLLLEHAGAVVTHEGIRQALWPVGTYVEFDGSLRAALKRLRYALGDDADNPTFIETVPKRGYRFVAPVTIVQASGEAAISADAQVQTPPDAARRYWPVLRYAGVAVVLLAIGTVWLSGHLKESPAKFLNLSLNANAHVSVRQAVAVLGFHNASGRAEDAWLSTAFSEMLSTELAGGEKLRLVSGEEVSNLRLSSPWPQTDSLDRSTTARIGTALNSDLLILGSYTATEGPEGGQLRLDIRLQEAKTGEILTEIAQAGDRQHVFQLVSGVGAKLRTRLGVPQLGEPEQASAVASMPMNREAARLYALGLSRLREFDSLAAKDLLLQACEADPGFSLAHLMLARAWGQLGYEQRKKEEAKKALDLSKGLPRSEQLMVQGDYYESLSDHEKAASTYRVLFELFPDSVEYGLLLTGAQLAAGHGNQASATLSQLRRLPAPGSDDPRIDLLDARAGAIDDPARLVLIRSAQRKAMAQGKKLLYAQARKEECLNLNYSMHPDQAPPACQEAYDTYLAAGNRLMAADALRLMGDCEGTLGQPVQAIATYERALKMLEELGEHYKTGAVLNNMAIVLANEGKLDLAEQLYRQAKFHFEQAGDKGNTSTALGNIADILFLRGDLPGAGKLYQQAFDIENSLDHSEPVYLLSRLSDLALTEGRVQDAHRLAQQAVAVGRQKQQAYQYLTSAMVSFGEALKAEGDLQGARQQFQEALDIRQKVGELGLVEEDQAEIADLDLDEGHPDQAEPLLRAAIPEFEREKSDPGATSAYTDLSRALLMEGKLADARNVIQRAVELARSSPDPALKLPIAIQKARVDMASAAHANQPLAATRAELRQAIATAKKLGYYGLECDARLALGEMEAKSSPKLGRSQLDALASEARRHGLELWARKAEQAIPGR